MTGVTTTPRGKRREKGEVQHKAESDFNLEEYQLKQLRPAEQWTSAYEVYRQLEEKLIICQQTAILNQKELQAEAEEAAAEAEADRQLTAARAAATLAKAASDREVARQIVRHRLERLKLKQQSLAGNITERSNIPGHGGDDQPMPNDRHDHVAYE